MDRLAQAKEHFEAALDCQQRGDLAQAEDRYRRALDLVPNRPSVMVNLAAVLLEMGRHQEAKSISEGLLAIEPENPAGLLNLGNSELKTGFAEEALISIEKALTIRPDYAEALVSRASALCDLDRSDEALASCEKALDLKPGYVEALVAQGIAMRRLGRYEEALERADAALSAHPEHAQAHCSRGNILADLGRHEEAAASYEKALAPGQDLDYALGALLHSRMHCCDWRSHSVDAERVVTGIRAAKRTIDPFFCLSVSGSAEDQLSCSQIWVRDRFPAREGSVWRGPQYGHDRIRLAYLSSDLGNHAVSLLMAGVFELHDRAKFETTAISFGGDDAKETPPRLKGAFEHFVDAREKSDREVAGLMRDLEIDIAVDLNGFTRGARTSVFARRAAPIQVNYLGYPGTLGAPYYDYILADRFVIPEDCVEFYSENVVRLPDCFQANDSKRRAADRTPSRSELGLPERGFVFCCANNSYKITPAMFDAWMRILRSVPESCLWLVSTQACVVPNLRKEAGARGVAPERMVFAEPAPYAQYLSRYRIADLFLDTLPFNGGTTASDALWAGLPVLTCPGESFAARMAGSLLNTLGLRELIAGSMEDYEALAVRLARDPERLAGLKRSLASARDESALFDTDRFRQNIERAYTAMWRRHRDGAPPVSFDVDRL
jgi:predicted O-linked N-acetylglucosamine transferase (SPINDLY family)